MTLVGRKAACINLDQDVKAILIHEYGIKNLSEFINDLLWAYVDENEPEVPVEIKRVVRVKELANKLRNQHKAQKKLLEEDRNLEQEHIDRVLKEERIFLAVARENLTQDPATYIKLLPECSHTDHEMFWMRKASLFSELCGFPVTPEQIQSYIRTVDV